MSTNTAQIQRVTRPLAPEAHPHIEIVTSREQRKARPRLAYAVIGIISLFVIFAAQLLLSIVVSDGAFQIEALQQTQKELLRTQDAASETLNLYGSTQNLATKAAGLGMVPNASPLTLDIGSGAVYAAPGTADPMGCGGGCNLITNSLMSRIPPLEAATPQTGHAAAAAPAATAATQTDTVATAPAATQPSAVTPAVPAPSVLPAPVTR